MIKYTTLTTKIEWEDLDLGKKFKPDRHLFYERCHICGKKLKHGNRWKTGDEMYISVGYDDNGKFTRYYCPECYDKTLANIVCEPPSLEE